MLAVYAGFNWIPALLSGAGWAVPNASGGIFYFNLGGVFGAITAGLLIARFGSKPTMLTVSVAAVISTLVLAKMKITATDPVLPVLAMLTIAGGLINAQMTTLYALAANVYPAAVRATGVGTAVAFGRLGAVLSASVGSKMLDLGGHAYYFASMAAAMAVCFAGLAMIQRHVRHK